ncbi:hypothetical protein CKM354_001161700 [Cercospora kikuchii]|uniref:Uncharacterized protein n=1 Tax=Cercospora kikuchii TaxID=84275 RepID=A0A9P3CTC5_9PEZI|nr:uncharacterized protein CKM354_001161700 [Cercospora kikuchii]GIZ48563.1 hypothetical protein CKM354_001161700 [Cercospora kikuchii]
MDALARFNHSLSWTRSWLAAHQQQATEDDFEVVDISEGNGFSRDEDVISLSSDDPITSCNESEFLHEPANFAFHPGSDIYSNPSTHATHPLHHNPLHDTDPLPSDHLAYATAGRNPTTPFQDLRSPSKAHNRTRKHSEKYYGHRHIKLGQLNQPHWDTWPPTKYIKITLPAYTVMPNAESPLQHEIKPTIMTKKQLYIEAQRWPRPPKYHRNRVDRDRWPFASHPDKDHLVKKHIRQIREQDEIEMFWDEEMIEEMVGREHEDREVDPRVENWCVCVWKGCKEYCVEHGYGIR